MVTFKHITKQDIEDRIQLRRAQCIERMESLKATADMGGVPVEWAANIVASMKRNMAPGGLHERGEHRLRADLSVPPAQRLRDAVDRWLPDARKDWHNRDEDFIEEYSHLPMLSEVALLLDFGEVEMAFEAMRKGYQGCFSEDFDPEGDIWMDVVFA